MSWNSVLSKILTTQTHSFHVQKTLRVYIYIISISTYTATGKTVSKYFSGILRCALISPRDNTLDIENASRSIDRVVSKAHWASPERNPTRYTIRSLYAYVLAVYVRVCTCEAAVLHTYVSIYATNVCMRIGIYIYIYKCARTGHT